MSDLPEAKAPSHRQVDVFHAQHPSATATTATTTCALSGCVHLRLRLRQDASMAELRAAVAQDLSRTLEARLAAVSGQGMGVWRGMGVWSGMGV